MGQALAAAVEESDDLTLAGVWRRGQSLADVAAGADVIVDFSLPGATTDVLQCATEHSIPLVCGVSGLDDHQVASLKSAASVIPLLFDRNMSLGIAVLQRAVASAAAALGNDFAAEIFEVHHVHKKDAPSGTALKLGEAIAVARGEQGTGSVDFAFERRGEVPGDHAVTLRSGAEKLVFSHSVTTRQVFADGALRAARWIIDQPAGLYSMQDMLLVPEHPARNG